MKEGIDWVQQVIAFWLSHEVKLADGATRQEIQETEMLIDFKFPEDFIQLYLRVNGFKEYDMILPSMVSIWSLHLVRENYHDARNNKNFVGFCDYLINSHWIGFFKNTEGIYKEYDEFNPICKPFREAILLINNDSDLIY